MRARLIRHGRYTPPGGGGGGVPALLANPFLIADYEDTATETSAVAVGRSYYGNFGSWSNSPTEYDYWVKRASDDTEVVSGTAEAHGEWVIDAGEELGGVGIYLESLARNLTGDAAASAVSGDYTVAAINVANAITAFSRTSGSGVSPMTASITFGANAEAGLGHIWFDRYQSDGTTYIDSSLPYYPTMAEISGGLTVSFDDFFASYGSTNKFKVVYAEQAFGGAPHTFTFPTAISPT